MVKFDFVINCELYNKLNEMALQKGKKVSEIVQEILIFMSSVLQMKHLTEDRRDNDYPVVDGKIRIRVGLPEYLYNQLKMVHDHLNTFSMAVLIREILIEYFDGVENCGEEEYKKEVMKVNNRVKFMKIKKCRCVNLDRKAEDIPQKFAKRSFYLIKLTENFCLKEFKFL